MFSKILIKSTSIIAVLVGIVFSVVIISFLFIDFINRESQSLANTTTVKSEQNIIVEKEPNSKLPLRLKIPILNIDTDIEYVGLTTQGEIGVPKGPSNVAWFKLGVKPGDIGSAVITGHYGWKDGVSAVFDNLSKLKNGDRIYVEDDSGTTTVFVVRESRRYDPKADAYSVFDSRDGISHLNLITCEGIWSKAEQSYSKRLVVFTDKE